MTNWTDPEFDPPGWDGTPQWRPRWGRLAVAVVVSCVLWAAVLVPLILWWPW
jgi:hypothetical protein